MDSGVKPDVSDCPKCGEWRDAPDVDCANCGFAPKYNGCGDPLGACMVNRPHDGDHKVPPDWAIARKARSDGA